MSASTSKKESESQGKIELSIYALCTLLMIVILLLDFSVPLGVAMGVPYIAVVLISLWSPGKNFTYIIAAASSVMTIAAFILKPPAGELWKVISNRGLALFAIWVTAILGIQIKISEQKREKALMEKEKALNDARILRGLLPICSSCKKIRDDKGYWNHLEEYIKNHSEADFTHSICPECTKNLYPEFYKKKYSGQTPEK